LDNFRIGAGETGGNLGPHRRTNTLLLVKRERKLEKPRKVERRGSPKKSREDTQATIREERLEGRETR